MLKSSMPRWASNARMVTSMVGAGITWGISPIAHAAPGETAYTIRLSRPQTQTVEIQAIFEPLESGPVELVMPTWRPGRYVILNQAGGVRTLRAEDGSGNLLPVTRPRTSHWRIDRGDSDRVIVTYELYANELNLRTRHVDDTHAFLSGSGVFLFDPALRDTTHRVFIEAPDGWDVATSLPLENGAYVAENFDVLVDSPFEIGVHEVYPFEVDGVPHEFVVWGDPDWQAMWAQPERFTEDLATIVREEAAIFGGLPYERYLFITHIAPGIGGGTEHLNSTIMQTQPNRLTSERGYEGFLALASHELFHAWNVKRFRPAGIARYDYDEENYTDLLWVVEGTTSYYDDLILARAGLIDVDDYLGRIRGSINSVRRSPGSAVQSVAASSFDAWVKFSAPTADSGNTTVSFYTKGSVVSLLLDMELRRLTGGERSMDDVMCALHERYPLGSAGYTTADLMTLLGGWTGTDWSDFFERYVSGTDTLPLETALATVGLKLTRDESDGEVTLGISARDGDGGAVVRSVREGEPAFDAGIAADDVIVAINGFRVGSAGELNDRIDALEPGDDVVLTLFRRDRLRQVELTAAERASGWSLERDPDANDAQRAAFEAWIGQPWLDEDKDTDGDSHQ